MRADTRINVDKKLPTMTGLIFDNTIYFHFSLKTMTTPTGTEEEIDEKTRMVLENSKPIKANGEKVTGADCKQGNCGEVMAINFCSLQSEQRDCRNYAQPRR